jgi:hypothetical protein
MLTTLVLTAGLLLGSQATFNAQSELQGLYGEISQTRVQAAGTSTTADDIDALHATVFTDDWTFVDKSGHSQTWMDLRQKEVDTSSRPPSHEMLYQPIKKLSLSSDGCTATVTIPDNGTTYEDTWVKIGESWKMKTRREL